MAETEIKSINGRKLCDQTARDMAGKVVSPTITVEAIAAEEAAVMTLSATDSEGVTATNYVQNGNFVDATGWFAGNGCAFSVENNAASVVADTTSNTPKLMQTISKDIMSQVSGDIWFVKAHIVPDITEPFSTNAPLANIALNTSGGYLAAKSITNFKNEADVYGTVQLSADSNINMTFVVSVEYLSGNTMARTCYFSKAMAVNLTEAYGAGNEPAADEFYEILSAYDNHFFDGTVTIGENTGSGGDDNTGDDTGEDDNTETPVVVPTTGDGYKITITDANGTQSFNLYHGADGVDGSDGKDGFSPTIECEEIEGGTRLNITDKNGEQTVDLLTGGALKARNCVTNGNFATADGWSVVAGGTMTVADNKATIYHDGASGSVCGVMQTISKDITSQVSGDVWFVKAHVEAEKYLVEASGDYFFPAVEIYMNTSGGLLYVHNTAAEKKSNDYYGTVTLTASANVNMTLFLRCQYNRAEYVAGRTCAFSNAMAVNLTEVFGAGNEPTADEFNALLGGFENEWFDGTENILSQTANIKRIVDTEKKTLKKDLVVTVGESGDFPTLSSALEYMSQFYPTYKNGGLNCEIKILSGTTITEQVAVVQIDMQYIKITSEDAVVPVDSTGWTSNGLDAHDLRGDVGFIGGENAAKLPTIGTVFQLVTKGEKPAVGYFANRGSEGVVLANCGFDGFYDGVIANNESSVTIREGISRNMERWGVHSRHNGEISARSCICTNCGIAAYADRVADLDVREADLSNSAQAIVAEHTSRINANGCHANGCGNDTTPSVTSGNGSVVNCTELEVTNSVGDIFSVSNGGTIIAFTPTTTGLAEGKVEFSQEKNTVYSAGIIYG